VEHSAGTTTCDGQGCGFLGVSGKYIETLRRCYCCILVSRIPDAVDASIYENSDSFEYTHVRDDERFDFAFASGTRGRIVGGV
jgi:hypothetical protein